MKRKIKKEKLNLMTVIFYSLIGLASSLTLSFLFYWTLRLDSTIATIVNNFVQGVLTPLYFWSYVSLTIATIILFGIAVPLLIHRWRKFGPPKIKGQAGAGFGSFAGILASGCPLCASTVLSAFGIASGLAAFPFGGLEIKAISLGLIAVPVWITARELKSGKCGGKSCPLPRDTSFKKSDIPWLIVSIVAVIAFAFVGWNMLESDPITAKSGITLSPVVGLINADENKLFSSNIPKTGNELVDEVVAEVLPEKGFQSKIYLGDSVVKLVENRAIDSEKFNYIYQNGGGLPDELKDVLNTPSYEPILLTRENANYYVNLLWPLGLANHMKSNKESPINGDSLFNFASTGGWNIGKEENGGAYFNKFEIVSLTPEQEALVTKIAQNTYRPCCNNPTFFQDCNHGSALLGLLELGASQGLSEDELYREALAFNSFWFPHNYIQTALYFKAVKNTNWENVDPKTVMGADFSSISGWYNNVNKNLQQLNLLPQTQGGGSCGI